MLLYNWLEQLEKDGKIKNLQLESYIPSTKQRPDIYFEVDEQKYVFEFQCSPIATEFIERRRLYQLANITDIWILGLEKYNLNIEEDYITHSMHYKTIEQHSDTYLDAKTGRVYIGRDIISNSLPYKIMYLSQFYTYDLTNFEVNSEHKALTLNNEALQPFIDEDKRLYDIKQNRVAFDTYINKSSQEVVIELNNYFKAEDITCNFVYRKGTGKYYICAIDFTNHDTEFTFFIKDNQIDCCVEYERSIPFRGKRGGLGWRKSTGYKNVDSVECDLTDKDIINSFIKDIVDNVVNRRKKKIVLEEKLKQEKKDKFFNLLKDFLDKEIFLINANKNRKINNAIRFKFLKEFKANDSYMQEVFINELNFLRRKNVDKYIFMIPRYHYYFNSLGFNKYISIENFNQEIINYFTSYGFTNVKYLKESE
jgi:competence protein CoiA